MQRPRRRSISFFLLRFSSSFFFVAVVAHRALDVCTNRRDARVSAFLPGIGVLCAAAATIRAYMHHGHVNAHAIMHVTQDRGR